MAYDVLEVIAKDEQEQHIPKNVHYPAVHEHGAQKIKIDGQRRRVMVDLAGVPQRITYHLNACYIDAGRYLFWDQRKCVGKMFVAAKLLQQQENKNVDANDRVIDYRLNVPV